MPKFLQRLAFFRSDIFIIRQQASGIQKKIRASLGDAAFFTACGYEVVATHGLKSVGPTAVARFAAEDIMAGFAATDHPQAEALIHVGTNLPVSALTPAIEQRFGKPLIGVNVATYWLALRRLGITDAMPGMGLLAEKY